MGAEAADIAGAASAAPPETADISLRISMPNPKEAQESSAKTVDAWLPKGRRGVFLDEKAEQPQCQKMVRKGDLSLPSERDWGLMVRDAASRLLTMRIKLSSRHLF